MQELTAVLGGKLVRYPMDATFIVERKSRKKGHRFLTQKSDIHSALHRFHQAVDDGLGKVVLSACFNGRVTKLLVEK